MDDGHGRHAPHRGPAHSAFDFDAAATHIQSYVLRVRACGGILPDEVVEPLYTATACRERWAHLDAVMCQAYRTAASEGFKSTPTAAATAAAVAAVDAPPPLEDEDDDDDDEPENYGILDLNALRAQRLGGAFGAAPSLPAKKKSEAAAAKRTSQTTAGRRSPANNAPPPPQATDASPDFTPLFGRSQQLAELEQLAAGLSNGEVRPSDAVGDGEETAQQLQAASTLLGPLGDLRKKMEGLEALLQDTSTDMAAKLGEVAQVHREMAELQNLAQKSQLEQQQQQIEEPPAKREPPSPPRSGGNAGPLQLDAALDGLDLDALIERLEAEKASGKEMN